MLKLFLASIIFISIAVAAIAIKMFLIKGATFKKGCSCGKNESNSSCTSVCDTEKPE